VVPHGCEERQDTGGSPLASSEHEAPASPSLEKSFHPAAQSDASSRKRARPLDDEERRRSQRAKKDSWRVIRARDGLEKFQQAKVY
jgi:hypothetical protein